MTTEREAFEVTIAAPPFEFGVGRFDDHGEWPGSYRHYDTDLSWQVWKAACAWQREQDARLCEDSDKSTHSSDLADKIRSGS